MGEYLNNDIYNVKQLIKLFNEEIKLHNQKIQTKVKRLLASLDKKGYSENDIFKKILVYNKKFKWFKKENLVDIFLFKYDINYPSFTKQYLKVREQLLSYLEPYQIIELEKANKDFPNFFLKTGRLNIQKIISVLEKLYSLETVNSKNSFLKLVTDPRWYLLDQNEFYNVSVNIDSIGSNTQVTPKLIKKILYEK